MKSLLICLIWLHEPIFCYSVEQLRDPGNEDFKNMKYHPIMENSSYKGNS